MDKLLTRIALSPLQSEIKHYLLEILTTRAIVIYQHALQLSAREVQGFVAHEIVHLRDHENENSKYVDDFISEFEKTTVHSDFQEIFAEIRSEYSESEVPGEFLSYIFESTIELGKSFQPLAEFIFGSSNPEVLKIVWEIVENTIVPMASIEELRGKKV